MFNYKCKIVILGKGGVGKSSLIIKLLKSRFLDIYDPTVIDTYYKNIIIDSIVWNIQIVDTSGQEEFQSLRDLAIKEGDGFIIVFGLNDKTSFEIVENIYHHILKVKNVGWIPCMFFGNKNDLIDKRNVELEVALFVAQHRHCIYNEGSALTGQSIETSFIELIRLINVNKRGVSKKKRNKCIIV